MKFCKTLQRAVEISDPSYVPYWTNYKRLKKIVKAISQERLIPETTTKRGVSTAAYHQEQGGRMHDDSSASKIWESTINEAFGEHLKSEGETTTTTSSGITGEGDGAQYESSRHHHRSTTAASSFQQRKKELESNPHEVAFFELLHAEFSKASKFFDKAQQQFIIREEIVSVGMKVLRSPQYTARSVKHRWGLLSKAVFLLYRDLLLFEVFAIMTYFAFSKILKKHDKVTGYHTRGAFMVNVVNKANFTTYPKILEMIQKCEELYNDASESLLLCLYEDERLFLHMISEWNIRLRQPVRGAVEDTRSLDPPAHTAATAAASAFRHVPGRMQEQAGGVQQGGGEQQASSRGVLLDEDREESSTSRDRNKSSAPTSLSPPDSGARRILFPPSHPKFRGHPPAPSREQEEAESKKPASKKPRKSDDAKEER